MQMLSGARKVARLSHINFQYFLFTQSFMSGGKVMIGDIVYFSLAPPPRFNRYRSLKIVNAVSTEI